LQSHQFRHEIKRSNSLSTPLPKPRPPVKPTRRPPEQPKNDPDVVCKVADGLKSMLVPVGDLQRDPDNARLHSEFQIAELSASLASIGQLKPIVVNAKTGVVAAGNATFAAAAKNGWTHIAAIKVDPAKHDLKRFAIADNRLADLSEFDDEALKVAMQSIDPDDRLGLGWSSEELAKMLDVPGDDPATLAPVDPTISAPDKQSKIAEATRVDFTAEQYGKIKAAIAAWVADGNEFEDDASAIVGICDSLMRRSKD